MVNPVLIDNFCFNIFFYFSVFGQRNERPKNYENKESGQFNHLSVNKLVVLGDEEFNSTRKIRFVVSFIYKHVQKGR